MPKNRIEELRKAKGISAVWLAKTIGVSRQTIHNIEKNHNDNRSIYIALRIAKVLDTTVDEMFK